MRPKPSTELLQRTPETWALLEALIASDPESREKALTELVALEGFQDQPLLIYLLATRTLDPDLKVRYSAVRILGGLLDEDPPGAGLADRSFRTITDFTTQLEGPELIKILEVSVHYLAAEEAVINILKLCSYAGKALGGIVNDRKLPVEIRQQAINFCGAVGFLNTATAIRNLLQRIEKNRNKTPAQLPRRKKQLDEEQLFPYAVTALAKLEN